MTEQTHIYRLPGHDERRGDSFDVASLELSAARAEAQPSQALKGELREVRATDPEALIDLGEEDTAGAFWRQQEAEQRLLERRQYDAKRSREERYAAIINGMEDADNITDIANTTIALCNYRTMEAA